MSKNMNSDTDMDKDTYTDYHILFNIFNDINITMINNNFSIKDKVCKKIEIIKVLSNSNIDILNYNNEKREQLFNILNSINYKLMSVQKKQNKLTSKLNTILGIIIHNAYISTGYQVLLSNIPKIAKQVIDNKINNIDDESIFDTIEYYIGNNTVLSIIQIDTDKYLAKFKDINDAEKLCNLIHNMLIETNIIRVEMLDTLDTMDTLDDLLINENENENNRQTQEQRKEQTKDKTKEQTQINDNDICDYGISKLNESSIFRICVKLLYDKYSKIQVKIKENIKHIFSFFVIKKKHV